MFNCIFCHFNTKNCRNPFIYWAIQEGGKGKGGGGRLRTYFFEQDPWNFKICHFTFGNPIKMKLQSYGNPTKLCYTILWNFQGQKTRWMDGNSMIFSLQILLPQPPSLSGIFWIWDSPFSLIFFHHLIGWVPSFSQERYSEIKVWLKLWSPTVNVRFSNPYIFWEVPTARLSLLKI